MHMFNHSLHQDLKLFFWSCFWACILYVQTAKGSGETVQICSLAWAFTAQIDVKHLFLPVTAHFMMYIRLV